MPKPRNVAGPVVRGADFWGRDKEYDALREMLERGSVLLVGPRRYGKSSLMYSIRDREETNRIVLLDVEFVESTDEFVTTVAAELLATDPIRGIFRQAQNVPRRLAGWVNSVIDEVSVGAAHLGELKLRLRQGLGSDNQSLDLVGELLAQLKGDRRLVMVLDEFPMMLGNMLAANSSEAIRFLKWFRTFRQNPAFSDLSFLLGGSVNIEPTLEALAQEALLGDLQRFRLLPFPPHVALLFLKEVLESEGNPCEDGVAEEILRVSATGVPYYLQVMINECLAEARRLERNLGPEDVVAVYEERVISPVNRHRFSHYHTRLGVHYGVYERAARVVLCALCGGRQSYSQLHTHLNEFGERDADLDRLLVMLEGDYYILRDADGVEFSDGLLMAWWKRNGTLPRRAQ